jgi:hypothetical protein
LAAKHLPHYARWPESRPYPKKTPPGTHLKHNHNQISNSSKIKTQIYTSTTKNVNNNPQIFFFFFSSTFIDRCPTSFVLLSFILSATKQRKLSKKKKGNETYGGLVEMSGGSGADLGEVGSGVFDGDVEGFFNGLYSTHRFLFFLDKKILFIFSRK